MKLLKTIVHATVAAAVMSALAGGPVLADDMTLDALKAKVQGKSITMAFGSTPNLLEVQSVMIAGILKDKFGVNATYQPLPADVSAAAVVSGSADIGEVSLGRIAGLKQGGADVQIFASNDYVNDFVILGKAPIKTMADLKGKVYGDSSSAGISQVLRDACYSGSGINVDDAQHVELGSSGATAQALSTPKLDAGLVHADAAATLQAKFPNTYNVLCYVYEKTSVANDVWYANKSWIDANPDLALAVSVSSMLAARQVYADKAGWLKVANSFVKDLLPGVAEQTYDLYKTIGLWDVNGALDMPDCKKNVDLLVSLDALPESIECSSFVTDSFQSQARKMLGMATK